MAMSHDGIVCWLQSVQEAIEMQLHREVVHAAIRRHRISTFFQPMAKCKSIPMTESDDPSLFAPVFPSQLVLRPQKPRKCHSTFRLKSPSKRPVRRPSCLGAKHRLPRQPKIKRHPGKVPNLPNTNLKSLFAFGFTGKRPRGASTSVTKTQMDAEVKKVEYSGTLLSTSP